MKFEKEVAENCGVEPQSWVYLPDAPDCSAILYFSHVESDDGDTLPLSFEDLQRIDGEYDIAYVESISSGMTGSRLAVGIHNP